MDSCDAESGGAAESEHFQMVPEANDHHFISYNTTKQSFSNINSSVYTRIMKEWKILKTSLPQSIYVQVYETRIDLLRAAIIGPPGTPYHDGLFFFDIALPPDYPNSPPLVHFRSHGYRLNPNLYTNGFVCLSLINTWIGTKCERWSAKSTILQVLVSIQGLVLNEWPYYNEPGYAIELKMNKGDGRTTWSIEYNEKMFVLSCKTMLQIMRRPPGNFKGFVLQHFRGRGEVILAAIEQYRLGRVLVGRFGLDEASSSSSSVGVSFGFKRCLARIEPMLRRAFAGEDVEESFFDKVLSFIEWICCCS